MILVVAFALPPGPNMQLLLNDHDTFVYSGGRPFDPSLPCVLFVHGAQHDHSVWALQTRYLAHHGRAVLVPDLPGHGRSTGNALESVEALADWLIALLDAAGVERATVVGHSMGALVAAEVAARHPTRITKIALIGATFPMLVSDELLNATRDDEPLAQDMINIWCHSSYAHYPGNPGPGFWVMAGNTRLMQRQPKSTLHTDFRACVNYKGGLEAAANTQCPVLFILAKRDVMTPIKGGRQFARAFRDARIVELTGTGHALMAENPDGVLDTLLEFV